MRCKNCIEFHRELTNPWENRTVQSMLIREHASVDQLEHGEDIRERAFRFGCNIIRFCE